MERKLVTPKQLAAYLTSELQKGEDCENLLIDSVVRLRYPDGQGCNWSENLIVTSTDGTPASNFHYRLGQIVLDSRTKFNLNYGDYG
jgi:hypothetical protein